MRDNGHKIFITTDKCVFPEVHQGGGYKKDEKQHGDEFEKLNKKLRKSAF